MHPHQLSPLEEAVQCRENLPAVMRNQHDRLQMRGSPATEEPLGRKLKRPPRGCSLLSRWGCAVWGMRAFRRKAGKSGLHLGKGWRCGLVRLWVPAGGWCWAKKGTGLTEPFNAVAGLDVPSTLSGGRLCASYLHPQGLIFHLWFPTIGGKGADPNWR